MKALCIHGHYYQPPRANPATGIIPREPGASPFHNWNEKIHAECYVPNAELGNFSRMSHDVGPTLARWMAAHDERTYGRIIDQGRKGSAMAQAYNHTILPLAERRDKITQVVWGVRDFEFRYGHSPRGMWLPETAVDIESLEVLAENGIEFTILAPWQADVDDLDVTVPYRVALPGGRSIVVFFYEGQLSGDVSFNDRMTENAEVFLADFVLPRFRTDSDRPQILTIASDGELYGHHKKLREHFLAHLINHAAAEHGVEIMVPEEWLDRYAVTETIRIRDNTSWSCHHGVARWSTGCDCTTGDPRWKNRLRASLNELAGRLDHVYAEFLRRRDLDPWQLRNDYIHVLLGTQSVEDLVEAQLGAQLDEEAIESIALLLRAQRMRQYMMTSCGWFFAGLGLEAKNNLLYAREAVALTARATGVYLASRGDLEPVQYLDAAA